MTAHFNHWINVHADMPTQDENGNWFDMEDGLAYDSNADYGFKSTPARTAKEEAIRKISLDKAKASRKLAKFYGGKALTGSPKQKSWGEAIRNTVLKSDSLSDEEKEKLVVVGGFTQSASFWIENKDVDPSLFTAKNIVSAYRKLTELENTYYDADRSHKTHQIKIAQKAIVDYMKSCDFEFKTQIERIQLMIEREKNDLKSKNKRDELMSKLRNRR